MHIPNLREDARRRGSREPYGRDGPSGLCVLECRLAFLGDPVDPTVGRRKLGLFSLNLDRFHVPFSVELAEEVQVLGELLLDLALG
jgi:hypothetical protein